jgi:multiple sugar transport system ATP-binding protein
MADIALNEVSFRHGEQVVFDDVSFAVSDGELLTVIGPSGSGKTTLLRLLAGLEQPDRGSIMFDGEPVNDTPPGERNVAMAFQEAVLYPHWNITRNVGFPLRLRKLAPAEIKRRVDAEVRARSLQPVAAVMPRQLSEGQRHLAQIARAMVRVPVVFLMDEPLANIEPSHRQAMRHELKTIQRGYGVTTVYATNDPEEAMALGDRMAVLGEGVIQQIGPPMKVYDIPLNRFVAGFVGSPSMNFIEVTVTRGDGGFWLERAGLRVRAWMPDLERYVGRAVAIGVRPEDVVVEEGSRTVGIVSSIEELGAHRLVTMDVAGGQVVMRSQGAAAAPGSNLPLAFLKGHVFGGDGVALPGELGHSD